MDLNRSFETSDFRGNIYLLFGLGGVLLLAFWIRVQGVGNIPAGQFTETDGYFYYWQAQLISEQGHLPARDMHRWLPIGRDLGQTLNLYGYVLAYTHKTLAWIFPNIPPLVSGLPLHAGRLLLYRSWRALSLLVPHLRTSLCKHRGYPFGNAAR